MRDRGELPHEDRHKDWAERPIAAATYGVRRMVERTIELAPYEDTRYLRAAATLLERDRRAEVLSVVNGLAPPWPRSASCHQGPCGAWSVRCSCEGCSRVMLV